MPDAGGRTGDAGGNDRAGAETGDRPHARTHTHHTTNPTYTAPPYPRSHRLWRRRPRRPPVPNGAHRHRAAVSTSPDFSFEEPSLFTLRAVWGAAPEPREARGEGSPGVSGFEMSVGLSQIAPQIRADACRVNLIAASPRARRGRWRSPRGRSSGCSKPAGGRVADNASQTAVGRQGKATPGRGLRPDPG